VTITPRLGQIGERSHHPNIRRVQRRHGVDVGGNTFQKVVRFPVIGQPGFIPDELPPMGR
jgi:hypothetical protein